MRGSPDVITECFFDSPPIDLVPPSDALDVDPEQDLDAVVGSGTG
jgi:hypothetical protein